VREWREEKLMITKEMLLSEEVLNDIASEHLVIEK